MALAVVLIILILTGIGQLIERWEHKVRWIREHPDNDGIYTDYRGAKRTIEGNVPLTYKRDPETGDLLEVTYNYGYVRRNMSEIYRNKAFEEAIRKDHENGDYSSAVYVYASDHCPKNLKELSHLGDYWEDVNTREKFFMTNLHRPTFDHILDEEDEKEYDEIKGWKSKRYGEIGPDFERIYVFIDPIKREIVRMTDATKWLLENKYDWGKDISLDTANGLIDFFNRHKDAEYLAYFWKKRNQSHDYNAHTCKQGKYLKEKELKAKQEEARQAEEAKEKEIESLNEEPQEKASQEELDKMWDELLEMVKELEELYPDDEDNDEKNDDEDYEEDYENMPEDEEELPFG